MYVLALDIDLAIHTFEQLLDNGQSETRASSRAAHLALLERRPHLRYETRLESAACVPDCGDEILAVCLDGQKYVASSREL